MADATWDDLVVTWDDMDYAFTGDALTDNSRAPHMIETEGLGTVEELM